MNKIKQFMHDFNLTDKKFAPMEKALVELCKPDHSELLERAKVMQSQLEGQAKEIADENHKGWGNTMWDSAVIICELVEALKGDID